MAKGFFSQTLVVLLGQAVEIDDVVNLLSDYTIAKRVAPSKNWELSGPSLLIEYRKEVNGYVAIDIVNQPWPDHMGSAQEEPFLFSAWSMGHFGPYTFPQGLERAVQQSWRWNGASKIVPRHQGFIRIRLSYVFGSKKDAPVAPKDYDPSHELHFLTDIAHNMLNHPQALCYFNPNGEVLLPRHLLEESFKYHTELNLPPFNLWCNVRLFNANEDWCLMDTVGNWQLDIPDQEVGFPSSIFSPQDVDYFMRNASLYLLQHGPIIEDGDTMDGPGDIRWQAKAFEHSIANPPRATLRWLPLKHNGIPELFFKDA